MYADQMNNAQAIRVLDQGKAVVAGLPTDQVGSGGNNFLGTEWEFQYDNQ